VVKQTLGRLLLGLFYGVCWFAALSNTLVLILQLASGSFEPGRFLPVAIGAWGIILYLHWVAGWFPFHRRT
jgi:hypothetical protein